MPPAAYDGSLGARTLRAWRRKVAAPVLLVVANASGFAFTPENVRFCALSAAYSILICLAATYVRILRRDDRGRVLQAAQGAAPVSFRDYDVAALRSLSSSLLVAAGSAWALHLAGVTTTLLLLQCALLPLACFDAEVVSLHLFQLPEGRPELQRPWPSETEKAEAALAELRAVFAA
jgi:Phosphate transport (Pho88)